MAAERSAATVKAAAEAQATDAERILIRALASARQMQPGERLSARDGAVRRNSIPRGRRSTCFRTKACIAGWPPNRWSNALLNAGAEVADVMEVPAPRASAGCWLRFC